MLQELPVRQIEQGEREKAKGERGKTLFARVQAPKRAQGLIPLFFHFDPFDFDLAV
jgi:hypothetical protein